MTLTPVRHHSTYLQSNGHELHPVIGHAVSELSSQVGQQVLRGASPHPREKVLGDVCDLETIESQFPAVTQPTQRQWKELDFRVAVERDKDLLMHGVCVCVCVYVCLSVCMCVLCICLYVCGACVCLYVCGG